MKTQSFYRRPKISIFLYSCCTHDESWRSLSSWYSHISGKEKNDLDFAWCDDVGDCHIDRVGNSVGDLPVGMSMRELVRRINWEGICLACWHHFSMAAFRYRVQSSVLAFTLLYYCCLSEYTHLCCLNPLRTLDYCSFSIPVWIAYQWFQENFWSINLDCDNWRVQNLILSNYRVSSLYKEQRDILHYAVTTMQKKHTQTHYPTILLVWRMRTT